MNELKFLSKNERLIEGNKNTEYIKNYLINRFNQKLISAPIILDIFGIDFLSLKENIDKISDINDIKNSFQGKVRATKWGMHFIYESCLIKPIDKDYSDFKITPGRDARGISDWYVCLTCTRSNIKFVKTKVVKEKIDHYLNKFLDDFNLKSKNFDLVEWAKDTKKNSSTMYEEAKKFNLNLENINCKLPDLSKLKILDYWNQAAASYNKYISLANYDDDKMFDEEINEYVYRNTNLYSKKADYYASRGIEIQFKLDEGFNKYSLPIGKILFYIPYVFFPEKIGDEVCKKKLNYLKNEEWNNKNTWIKR